MLKLFCHNQSLFPVFTMMSNADLQPMAAPAGPALTVTPGVVRYAAMSLLARREHSRQELTEKLLKRFEDSDLIAETVQNLADEALQSDDRFTEAFVSMRKRRGQGPMRIAGDLRQKGVAPELIERYVDRTSEDEWLVIAQDICRRKYSGAGGTVMDKQESDKKKLREKARRVRFLQYRGFSADIIRKVLP